VLYPARIEDRIEEGTRAIKEGTEGLQIGEGSELPAYEEHDIQTNCPSEINDVRLASTGVI